MRATSLQGPQVPPDLTASALGRPIVLGVALVTYVYNQVCCGGSGGCLDALDESVGFRDL